MTRGVPAPHLPRCGAPTRRGVPCQRPEAVAGGRCSWHAGEWRRLPRKLPKRRPRINQRGEIRCANCKHYLPADQFRWLTAPSLKKPRFNSWCHDCQRALDRLRWRGERRATSNRTRLIRQRRQQRREQRDRIEFVQTSIGLLRRRGFTKTEIAKLCGTTLITLLDWKRGARRVTANGSHRVAVVMKETAYLKVGPAPCYRRRLPHPDLALLLARIAPQLAPYPLRSRWRQRDERIAA